MVSIAVETFGVCDFSRLAVTDWRLRRWRLWFLALMTATQISNWQRVLFLRQKYCMLLFPFLKLFMHDSNPIIIVSFTLFFRVSQG